MQRGILAHELFHGIDGVEAARPEVLVVPGVLADGDGEANAFEFDHLLRAGWREVALLIEDVVKGQEPLVLFEEQLAAVDEDGGVEGRLAVFAAGGQGHARQDGSGQVARGGASSSTAVRQRARKLGFSRSRRADSRRWRARRRPSDARLKSAARRLKATIFSEVSSEIPDRRIDLGQCDLHKSSVNAGNAMVAEYAG